MAVLAAGALCVPVLFLDLPDPAAPPRHTTFPGLSPLMESAAATVAAEPGPTSPSGELPGPQPAPAGGDPAGPLPIVDRRRVQGDFAQPAQPGAGAATAGATPRSPPRLDRSAEVRRRRVSELGGTPRTEDAVEAGLAWLAAHQSGDGTWRRVEYMERCPPDDLCPGQAVSRTEDWLVAGTTALSLLAFLGAGYTDREGPHQGVVGGGVRALLDRQRPDGGFCATESMAGYNNTLATLALAEHYALTRNQELVEPLTRAVNQLVQTQQQLGGWDYVPRSDSGRNDTSITAWAMQALQAAAAAGIEVPGATFVKAAVHFTRAAEPDGRVWYADFGTGYGVDPQTLRPMYRYGPAMTAAGMTCEQLLGWRTDSPLRLKQQALLFSQLPSAALLQGRDRLQLHSYYYWYYGTVAMFQCGGEAWQRWNAHLRDAILPLQNRDKRADGQKSHAYGSWQPFGPNWGRWGRMGGRVYTTALCVLTLEIYYRHTPAYLDDYLVLSAADWQAYLRPAGQRERRWVLDYLREARLEVAEPVLVGLLEGRDRQAALAAAVILAESGSPLGRPLLDEVVTALPPWERKPVERALARAREIESWVPAAGRVREYDARSRLATLDLPRAYVGMALAVRRGGEEIARMRVIQRFTGRDVVVAELRDQETVASPRAGDEVVSGP
ncbi:MAG: hypothetical protein KKB50_16720 [Planctomycetes bacterium]|nr:hypothetical protein [Planctomycetota bacterium]